jgi:hypothetical protein
MAMEVPMKRIASITLAVLVLCPITFAQSQTQSATQAPATRPPQQFTLLTYMRQSQANVWRDVLEAAEAMPEDAYTFAPTGETRPFSQVASHIALSSLSSCAVLLDHMPAGATLPDDIPRSRADVVAFTKAEREDTPRSKSQVLALLTRADATCKAVFGAITDANLTEMLTIGATNQIARGVLLSNEIGHANEVYGTMAVYLRLKGVVPPSTARQRNRSGGLP